jgi:UDP-N-acetylmuramate dehydrogenase
MEWSRTWFETDEIEGREGDGWKGVIREGVSLGKHSHMRIGGNASVFIEPWAEEDAAHVVRVCREKGLPYRVLGGGSNLLISDEGVDEVVLYLGQWKRVVRDEQVLIASAGASLPSLLRMAKEAKLTGLEHLIGIPAMVGGAVAMNAGTRYGECFDTLQSVRLISAQGELETRERADCSPGYRDGGLGEAIVTTASFGLEPGNVHEIQERMERMLKERNQTQPVSERSCGCIFENPKGPDVPEGCSAGRLIDEAGLKGERVGDIEVSTKHANYFVNKGEGTAAQVLELIQRVRERVLESSGIRLELEVKLWGF